MDRRQGASGFPWRALGAAPHRVQDLLSPEVLQEWAVCSSVRSLRSRPVFARLAQGQGQCRPLKNDKPAAGGTAKDTSRHSSVESPRGGIKLPARARRNVFACTASMFFGRKRQDGAPDATPGKGSKCKRLTRNKDGCQAGKGRKIRMVYFYSPLQSGLLCIAAIFFTVFKPKVPRVNQCRTEQGCPKANTRPWPERTKRPLSLFRAT